MNLYVQSAGVQQRLVEAIEEAVGAPVSIEQTSVTPWNGVTLKGISIASARDPKQPFLTAKSFSARVSVPQLISKRIVVKQIRIEEPKMVWRQASDGRWHLPGSEPDDIPEEKPRKRKKDRNVAKEQKPRAPEPAPLAAATAAPPAPGAPSAPLIKSEPVVLAAATPTEVPVQEPEPQTEPKEKFEVEVRRVRINKGDFLFQDRKGDRMCDLKGVELFLKMETPQLAEGDLKIESLNLRDVFHLNKVKTLFSHTPEHLKLTDLSAVMAGGTLKLNGQFAPDTADTPFTVETQVEGADLDTLVYEATGQRRLFNGTLQGDLTISGNAGTPESQAGKGMLKLVNGGLQEIPVLKSLGSWLKIDELQNLSFTKSEIIYRVGNAKFYVEPLLLESENLRLVANGEISYDGDVMLHARLFASNQLTKRLPSEIRSSFSPSEDNTEYGFVAFEVSGTVDRLETDLDERLIPKKLRNIYDGLKGLKELF